MKKSRVKWAAVLTVGVLLAGSILSPVTASAKKKKVDLDGTYHAALGISTATQIWINRNAYFAEDANVYYGTDQWTKLMSEDSATGDKVEHEGNFTDVTIEGNGTYTVKLDGADFEGETAICMLHVATDIPVNEKITFSNVSAKINGKTIVTFEEPYMEDEENYLTGGMDIILMNHWREELIKQLSDRGIRESSTNGYDLLSGAGNDAVEITFTVSGFNYDKEVVETPEPTKIPESTEVPVSVSENRENSSSSAESKVSSSGPIIAVVAAAVVCCGAVIVIVNGRRKRK